jgi:16S rRNA (guanine1207-N2)-methyltransferase
VEGALLFHPKGKERLALTLRLLAGVLPESAPFWLVGTKAEGMGSAESVLARVAQVTGRASGRHAKLLRGAILPGAPLALRESTAEVTVSVGERALTLASLPGVFSHGALDDGTRLLLETVPHLTAPLLDVGSGAGVIGTWYGKTAGGNVTLIDADALAVVASTATLAMNQVSGEALHGDIFPPEGRFMSIVSNPPFHQGVRTDYRVLRDLIAGAPARLAPGGTLTLVCNRFLPVQDLLDAAFGGHRVLADDGRYRVLQAP